MNAHRVVYALWYGDFLAALEVCHRCDNPPCCNPQHLWLGTTADNVRDMVSKGRHQHGDSSWSARLTESQVLEIRRLAGTQTISALARQFGVGRNAVRSILTRQTWTDLPGEAYVFDAQTRGQHTGKAHLTDAQVLHIRALAGTASCAVLGRQFGVGPRTVRSILTRQTWTDLPGEAYVPPVLAPGTLRYPEYAARGERHGRALLTAEQVLQIRALRGTITGGEIARQFGVSQPTISAILRRRIWKHLPDEPHG